LYIAHKLEKMQAPVISVAFCGKRSLSCSKASSVPSVYVSVLFQAFVPISNAGEIDEAFICFTKGKKNQNNTSRFGVEKGGLSPFSF
jgi:hypothetical protein